ncbi:hypothetical protein [Hymenobacter defluvii]|uniref:Uncharacterized protein n=1 Tax=Hymenobacter defluvii TaxID=2054411 RepID=A0ABS3THF8_9BACT|nr:hypothetical protein [Hymenobacter defluvii]MBO3272145.1 hypothetical protein [Hymenobacter defluvii]
MSSKKLATAADLEYYRGHQAYIRTFKYTPLNQFDHLLCIHGDRGQGTTGEVAYLTISAAAYEAIAARFPIEDWELSLFRSEFFPVGKSWRWCCKSRRPRLPSEC